MVAVVVAKWVGDWMNHSLYHALLHLKHIPYLGDPHKSLTSSGEIYPLQLHVILVVGLFVS